MVHLKIISSQKSSNMGLVVVAEGIENYDICSIIETLGCDYGQGYHVARPMTSDSFTGWLEERQSA